MWRLKHGNDSGERERDLHDDTDKHRKQFDYVMLLLCLIASHVDSTQPSLPGPLPFNSVVCQQPITSSQLGNLKRLPI